MPLSAEARDQGRAGNKLGLEAAVGELEELPFEGKVLQQPASTCRVCFRFGTEKRGSLVASGTFSPRGPLLTARFLQSPGRVSPPKTVSLKCVPKC